MIPSDAPLAADEPVAGPEALAEAHRKSVRTMGKALSEGRPEARRSGKGVGWPHTSGEVGERKAPGPGGAKAASVRTELLEGNMPSSPDRGTACHQDFGR